jgi:acid stress-induced BolA-like protein IbaG/YrbA
MADDALKETIKDVLQKNYFKGQDEYVDVSDGEGDSVHVLIISRQLGGKRAKEKRDLIWGELTAHLKPEQWQRISLLVAKTPDEVVAG